MTAYRAPGDKRLDVYFVGTGVPEDTLTWFQDQILSLYEDSVEDSSCLAIVNTDENYYGAMQMTTYMAAGEGDIYLLPAEEFEQMKDSGGFAPLDAAIADGTIDLRGIDVSSAVVYDEQGMPSSVAIPTESLYGLMDLGIDNRDAYLCVMITSQNQQTAFSFVNWIIENMLAEKPQWLVEQEESASSQADFTPSDIASY